MKKQFIILALASLTMTSCYRVSPDPGVESVLVYKPMLFGHGGVDPTPVSTGATWCSLTTDHKEFQITPITITEEFVNMIPSDNTPISFSAYLKMQVISGKTPELYDKFGSDWYVHNIQPTFRAMVRDKASIYTMFQLSSKREISARLEKEIFTDIEAYAKKLGIPVKVLQVSIGAITPPEQVLAETRNTAAQNQSILTQTARANSELARKQAEVNKAIADKAYQQQMGMTTQEYLHLRQLEIEKEKVEKVMDSKNVTVIFNSASPLSTTYPIK